MKVNKRWFFMMLCLFSIGFSGCWDRRELETLGLVQALGLDLGPNGKGVTVTTMIAIPSKLAGGGGGQSGGGGDEGGVLTISMDAPTIYEAFNRINTTINREITLLQNSAIIMGEDMAKSGMRKWVDTLVRFREMRRTVQFFVAKDKAAEVLKVQPKLEKNPSEYFTDLASLATRTGMFPMTTINSLMFGIEAAGEDGYAPMLAKFTPPEPASPPKGAEGGKKPENKGSPDQEKSQTKNESGEGGDEKPAGQGGGEPEKLEHIRVVGTAVFRKDRMVGTLDIYESQILNLLTDQFREALLTFPDPRRKEAYVAVRLIKAAPPSIKYRAQDGDRIEAILNLEAELLSIQSGINYTTPQNERFLSKKLAASIKRRAVKVVTKVQQQYQADIFNFGGYVRSTFLTTQAWDDFDWPRRFKDAKVNLTVKVAIRRIGVQFQPPQAK